MQSNYNNRDFEQFVKQNADQYRMFPSEKVWKGVYSALHTRRRWYGIGLALLLLLTAGTVTWVMISSSTNSKQIGDTRSLIASKDNGSTDQRSTSKTVLSPRLPKSNSAAPINSLAKTGNSSSSVFDVVTPLVVNRSSDVVVEEPVVITTEAPATTTQPQPSTDVAVTKPVENNHTIINTVKPVEKIDINTPVIDNDPGMPEVAVTKKQEPVVAVKKAEVYPLGIESVVNAFQAGKKKNKLSVQLYFTPTVSYRKLRENKAYLNSPAFAGRGLTSANLPSLTDVNSVVTHKPDLGLEVGVAAGYQVNSKLKLRAGLQFNVSRYDIKAFIYNGEVVTIALNNGMDSVKAFSNHGNLGGYSPDWLQNLYFSVSAPIGAELKLSDNGKTHTGIAASLQPTYILGDRAYLISTDYKNYAEVPGLVRHLNLNTSFEAFIAYTTGKLKWQVGPQFRYQVFSSFKQKYPVRENLFDFGLKVGIMLNR